MSTANQPNSEAAERIPGPVKRRSKVSVAGLLVVLALLAYFLLLPLLMPPPQVSYKVSSSGNREIAVDVTVTSYNGDYLLELLQPRFYVTPESTRVAVKLQSPYRAGTVRPPISSRYFTYKQTRQYHFVGAPEYKSLQDPKATSGTLDAKLVLYAAAEPAPFEDFYYQFMIWTRGEVAVTTWNSMRQVTPVKQFVELK